MTPPGHGFHLVEEVRDMLLAPVRLMAHVPEVLAAVGAHYPLGL